jgi:hypothetical protein
MAARHVLVPLGVVAIALAILLWRDGEEAPVVDLPDDVRACASNLRAIHAALGEHVRDHGSVPQVAGPALLGALLASGALADPAVLACPGPGAEPVSGPSGADLSSAGTGYAARDARTHPLAKFPAGGAELEPVAACDNARGLNHDGCMNVLYSDGSVVTLTLAHEIASGRLAEGATTIPVGPLSTHPDLVKLAP